MALAQNFKKSPFPTLSPGRFIYKTVVFVSLTAGFWICLWRMVRPIEAASISVSSVVGIHEDAPYLETETPEQAAAPIPIPPPPDANLPLSAKTILIDPGHGGSDPGTRGDQLFEKDGTLPIALAVAKELRSRNRAVALTRDSDTTVSLESRSRMANEPNILCMISIHLNHSVSSKSTGIETYYGWPKRLEIMRQLHANAEAADVPPPTEEREKHFAESLHASAVFATGAKDREVRNKNTYYLLNTIQVPSVILECGFVSNKAEKENLTDPDYHKRLAMGIADGIENFLDSISSPP